LGSKGYLHWYDAIYVGSVIRSGINIHLPTTRSLVAKSYGGINKHIIKKPTFI